MPRDGICVRSADGWSLLTPRARICLVVRRVGSLYDMALAVIFLVVRRAGSLSYTPRAAICLVVKRIRRFFFTRSALNSVSSFVGWGMSLTRPVLCPVLRPVLVSVSG